jgi:DNA-binding GntR family transcriptional regulator
MPQIVVVEDSPPALEPIDGRRDSLTSQVHDAIRDAIVSKQLPPGMRLSEAALAEQLGVSKTPVREALVRLQAIGLVDTEVGAGARVVTPSRERIQHSYEVRSGHEFTAARLAALRASEEDIAGLILAADQSVVRATSGDAAGFRECDARFHRGVAAAAGNPLLVQLVENSFSLTWALRRRDVGVTGDSIACAHQHVSIAKAIRARQENIAAGEMLIHINKVMSMVLAAFEDGETAIA